MTNPNKFVRKAIYDAVKATFPCYDMQVPGNVAPGQYVILSSQNKEIDKANKCQYRWVSYTLIEMIVIYNGSGNTGSRVANDDMENTVLGLIENLVVPGYEVVNTVYEFPQNQETITTTQIANRNFIRLALTLK